MNKMIQLIEIAHAKSGDKGNNCNIGVIARKPEYFVILDKYLTPEVVKRHFAGLCGGEVVRYDLPNLHALNFILKDALDGGATQSLRIDTQGKTMCEALLMLKIEVNEEESRILENVS